MNITVKKDGQDIEFLYSKDNIGRKGNFVFHNWTNDNYKGAEDEPFVFIGGKSDDNTNPELMEKYRLQAEGLIKKQLGIVDVVETLVAEDVKKEATPEEVDAMVSEPAEETTSEVEPVDEIDEDLKKKIQD